MKKSRENIKLFIIIAAAVIIRIFIFVMIIKLIETVSLESMRERLADEDYIHELFGSSDTIIEIEGAFVTEEDVELGLTENDYYDTPEEALRNRSLSDNEESYRLNVDETIKIWENDTHLLVYYRSVKNTKTECFSLAKLKKDYFDSTIKYAFITCNFIECYKSAQSAAQGKSLIIMQLYTSESILAVSLDPENTRFMWGLHDSDEIYSLEIDGQKPDEIIEYDLFGEKEYFWYYEDLQSDEPIKSLEITLVEE